MEAVSSAYADYRATLKEEAWSPQAAPHSFIAKEQLTKEDHPKMGSLKIKRV